MSTLYDKLSGNPYVNINDEEEERIEAESRARRHVLTSSQTELPPALTFVININLVLNVHLS